ncbi:MAG: MBL fold metallo-hydrolase [Pseudomonadota bacterium]
MSLKSTILSTAFASLLAFTSPAFADLAVHTYSSPDPDSVNTFAVETAEGLVVISTQRTFSEARNAVARIERTGLPVAAIVIPVPHTDHFGGLSAFREAFPEVPVYASKATIRSMKTDGEGYIASRKSALGDNFPSQEQVIAALPDRVLEDGAVLEFGDVRFETIEVPNANAPSNTMLYVAEEGALFSVEVVEDGVTAFLKDADLDGWIETAEGLKTRLPDLEIVYGAHNAPAPADYAISQQLAHLNAYRSALDEALADGEITDTERAEAVAAIDAAFPDHAQVARVDRARLIGLNLDWQAEKRNRSN